LQSSPERPDITWFQTTSHDEVLAKPVVHVESSSDRPNQVRFFYFYFYLFPFFSNGQPFAGKVSGLVGISILSRKLLSKEERAVVTTSKSVNQSRAFSDSILVNRRFQSAVAVVRSNTIKQQQLSENNNFLTEGPEETRKQEKMTVKIGGESEMQM
jgi:hypothetical protein